MKLAPGLGAEVLEPESMRAFLDDQWHQQVQPAVKSTVVVDEEVST